MPAPRTAEVFEYLDDLRESGVTNMWGATPYVAKRFGLDQTEAGRLHVGWMESFEPGKSPAERAEAFDGGLARGEA